MMELCDTWFSRYLKDGDITTIGRGGSDATVAAIAKIFQTDFCEFIQTWMEYILVIQ